MNHAQRSKIGQIRASFDLDMWDLNHVWMDALKKRGADGLTIREWNRWDHEKNMLRHKERLAIKRVKASSS